MYDCVSVRGFMGMRAEAFVGGLAFLRSGL